jgi:serine protease Do
MRHRRTEQRMENAVSTQAKAIAASVPAQRWGGLAAALALGLAIAVSPAMPALSQDLPNRPATFAELAESVSPAVVNITTSTVIAANTGPQGIVPEGSPFEDFFRDFQDRQGPNGPRRSSALGSGFVISPDGYIVTNNHVIEGADEIEIEFFPGGGELMRAELIGTDPNTDIALLKVDATDLPYVEFGDSDGPGSRVGDWVMAMGNPLGQGFSVSAGIISARNRALQGTYDDYIQTDAAINRGNSGGPLFNMDGEVIGVNTAILSPNGGSIGIGFAMSAAVVQNVVDQLREFGETRRGWLGVRIQDVTPDMVDAIEGLESVRGALITDVPPGPALDAGLEAGDVILTFDGLDVPDTRELVRMVGNAPVGKEVAVDVLRSGEMIALSVTLGRREDAEAVVPASAEAEPEAPVAADILGMTLSPVTEEVAAQFGLPADTTGIVVTEVTLGSDAEGKGILAGDVITEAGQQPVTGVADLEERIAEATDAGRKSLLLLIRRGGDPRFVALDITGE